MPNIIIDKEELYQLCTSLGYGYNENNRMPLTDAFKLAFEHCPIHSQENMRFKLWLTKKTPGKNVWRLCLSSPELGADKTLASFTLSKATQLLQYTIETFHPKLDMLSYCNFIVDAFDTFKNCAGKNYIDALLESILRDMDAVKVSIYGRLYFIPQDSEVKIAIFEKFLMGMVACGTNQMMEVNFNYISIAGTEKQRLIFAREFHQEVQKIVEEYTAKLSGLMETGGNQITMMKWQEKIQALDKRIQKFQNLFHVNWTDLQKEVINLQAVVQELLLKAS